MSMSLHITRQLPSHFARDFKPERRLLAQLLAFAKTNGQGTIQKISEATSIPTGRYTGKVEPMIFYAMGMGLLIASKEDKTWDLRLSPLGVLVLKEDPYLSERVSLWLMHLMMCRPLNTPDLIGVVDPWFALFSLGEMRLGTVFTALDYWAFLKERMGESTYLQAMAGVILRSYEEDSCLGLIHAISSQDNEGSQRYMRNPAPLDIELFPVYTAYFFLLWDEFFIANRQIHLDEFLHSTRMLNVLNWTRDNAQTWLDWAVDKGVLQLDRQTGDSLVLRTCTTNTVLDAIYSELI